MENNKTLIHPSLVDIIQASTTERNIANANLKSLSNKPSNDNSTGPIIIKHIIHYIDNDDDNFVKNIKDDMERKTNQTNVTVKHISNYSVADDEIQNIDIIGDNNDTPNLSSLWMNKTSHQNGNKSLTNKNNNNDKICEVTITDNTSQDISNKNNDNNNDDSIDGSNTEDIMDDNWFPFDI